MSVLFTNNATSTLAAAITAGQGTITIQAADAAKFPAPAAGDWFPVTVTDGPNIEVMRCTARTSVTLTVARGQEGTAARAFANGSLVDHRLTMAALQALLQDAPNDGKSYLRRNAAWVAPATADTRNRIVNPAMQVSQERGNNAGTVNSYYPADQWTISYNTGTLTAQRVQVPTPNESRDRFRITVTAALAALIANSVARFETSIEGVQVADFGYGAAGAKQAVLRFGFKGPAGTYSVVIANDAYNRCYLANFTIAAGQANIDTEQVFVIPGDVTGTWLTGDSGAGLRIGVCFAAGTTYQGVAGWQGVIKFGTAANTNGVAVAGAVFELFDIGLYLDPLATGLPPSWQLPEYSDELARCQRYWQQVNNSYVGAVQASTNYFVQTTLIVTPRPGSALSGVDNGAVSGFPTASAAVVMLNSGNSFQESRSSNSGLTQGTYGRWTTIITVNGRM